MKKMVRFILLCVFFLSVSAFAVHSQDKEKRAPKLKVDEVSHHFGEVREGESLTHIFKIRNVGNQPLVIEKVSGT